MIGAVVLSLIDMTKNVVLDFQMVEQDRSWKSRCVMRGLFCPQYVTER
jgi:hypothetical protein